MIIFGQQNYVERIKCYRESISPLDELQTFSFPFEEQNPAQYVFDFSVFDEELIRLDKKIPIVVAFGAQYQQAAVDHIKKYGFSNIVLFDASMDNDLKKQVFKKLYAKQGKDFSIIDEEKSVVIYMAKSIVDKNLRNDLHTLSPYIIPIQVGAALTEKRIADVTDDTGDNISIHNRHFSETTALYWMWKNAEADYLGLCHYRRHWNNLDVIVEKLQQDIIDVVLPVPTLCVHSVFEDYMEKYIPEVYPVMLDVLREMSPEYYEASKSIYKGQIFYACNMLIARRSVLHELCKWMFPIVLEIERRVGELTDSYHNRYAGFCTERLITLFFIFNKNNWRISHADKIFIE